MAPSMFTSLPPVTAGESAERMNLAGMDFVSLRLVVLCAELGSLSIAAKHANMSLSCASHRLSTAEEVFGARLFAPLPRSPRSRCSA